HRRRGAGPDGGAAAQCRGQPVCPGRSRRRPVDEGSWWPVDEGGRWPGQEGGRRAGQEGGQQPAEEEGGHRGEARLRAATGAARSPRRAESAYPDVACPCLLSSGWSRLDDCPARGVCPHLTDRRPTDPRQTQEVTDSPCPLAIPLLTVILRRRCHRAPRWSPLSPDCIPSSGRLCPGWRRVCSAHSVPACAHWPSRRC